MTAEVSTIANGLTVVTETMPHLETLALGVYVGVGARHESEALSGISHLIEHMAFKGTSRRSARDIAEEIESVGGELNAATSLEQTAYYARVLKGDAGLALEILADILQDSTFAADELEREREVILQEIAGIKDSPDEIAYDLLHDAAFPAQSVGRPIIGTPATVKAITRDELRGFLAARYRPASIIVSAAGAIDHATVVRHVEALFGGLTPGDNGGEERARYEGGLRTWDKPFEQSHLLLGFEGPSYRHATFYAAQVFSALFGGGMSSRLFQEVRERRGLCYSIYSSAWGLKDSGMLGIHAATGKDMMAELIDVIGAELVRVADRGPEPAEIQRAKAQIKAGLLMSLESPSARAEQMARQLMAFGRLLPVDELISSIEGVSRDQLTAYAGGIAASKPSVVVVGAGRRSRGFAERAERVIGKA
jgi:predicted Zn-dependent peptidase